MKAPQNMTQKVYGPTLRQYEIILPAGVYTSGTYTIPNGRTWNDFKIIIGTLGRGTGQSGTASTTLLDGQFTSLNWNAEMNPDSDGQSWGNLRRASSTTFTITRASTGGANMLIGYLR
jgi:hypothetical protein